MAVHDSVSHLAAMAPGTLVALVLLGLLGGIGITAIGPGGVLVTIALFVLTGLPPAVIAGTAIATHIATGALGTAAYARSGQLRQPLTARTGWLLAGSAVAGTPLGVLAGMHVSGRAFGVLLGVFVALVGAGVWLREWRGGAAGSVHRRHPAALLGAIGFSVSATSGLFGVGGPMLSVPLLVAADTPVLSALAAAQAQSVVIASFGTAGYLLRGDVDWPLAALVGVPELAGVLIGWKVARAMPARVLKYALVAALLCVAPYLAAHG